jgi:membrane peptidoglycan carboxypeptidase
VYREPTCVKTIRDSDNNVIYTSQVLQEVIYTETAARMTTEGLVAVMEEGTGKNHKLVDMPCAGKTGTTNQNKDGWFVGYTRYYTTSVWVGCDTPKEVEDLKGSTYPGLIWNTFMTKLHEGFAPMDFLPYAQLSDDFLNAQEEEKNRHNTDEDGDGIPDEEENPDGENAEEQQPEDDAAGQAPDEQQPDDNNAGDGTGDEETPEDNHAGDDGNADEETAGDNGNADVETPEDNPEATVPEDDNGDAGEADYPGADENQQPVE